MGLSLGNSKLYKGFVNDASIWPNLKGGNKKLINLIDIHQLKLRPTQTSAID